MKDSQKKENDGNGQTKTITIIINGRTHETDKRELSFSELVAMAFENPPTGQNIVFTITYRRGMGNKPDGSMVEGETVKLKNGMIFNVTATDKS